ncbi:MAG: hypothetical protein M1828_003075 [Chrysothrix sp. TS-e1954]|nr:MAG: hypothetical protein M1828_003075 [Chrysothrix sp. TS-e1954]
MNIFTKSFRLSTTLSRSPHSSPLHLHLPPHTTNLHATLLRPPRRHFPRYSSTTTSSTSPTPKKPASQSAGAPSLGVEGAPWRPAPHRDPNEPVYELYFSCNRCKHRSGHTISKQGYHKGTTLVKCAGCGVRHLISDHLKIFTDKATTLEDIMREKGEEVTRGTVNDHGDVELWDEESYIRKQSEARRAGQYEEDGGARALT